MGKVTSNKTLKRSRGKGYETAAVDPAGCSPQESRKVPGGMILKFSLGRQVLKDLQPLEQGSPASRI